jgi:hypothetical protein
MNKTYMNIDEFVKETFPERYNESKPEEEFPLQKYIENFSTEFSINLKKIKKAQTAHNRPVYASPPYGGSASATARSFRYAPFPRHCSGAFWPPCKCYAFAYSGGQNIVNSQDVIRH